MSIRSKTNELRTWLGEHFKTDAALRRNIEGVPFQLISEVHVDALIYEHGMQHHRFQHIELSRQYSPGDNTHWDALNAAMRELLSEQEDSIRDISLLDISGIQASKSIGRWKSMEEFGRSPNCSNIHRITDSDFEHNVKHSFPTTKHPVTLERIWWNGRLSWVNSDGSHHAAAAYVQALDQGKNFVIPGQIVDVWVNETAGRTIIDNFYGLIVERTVADQLWYILNRFDVPFQHGTYKPAGDHLTLMFFPRSSKKAEVAVSAIQGIGSDTAVFDFVGFLRDSISA
jgi:hypothetical protein